jgi:hypothetical protein
LISPGGSATLPEVIGSLFGVGIGHKNELLELEEVVVPSEEVEYFYGIAHKNHQNITEKIYQNTRLIKLFELHLNLILDYPAS